MDRAGGPVYKSKNVRPYTPAALWIDLYRYLGSIKYSFYNADH